MPYISRVKYSLAKFQNKTQEELIHMYVEMCATLHSTPPPTAADVKTGSAAATSGTTAITDTKSDAKKLKEIVYNTLAQLDTTTNPKERVIWWSDRPTLHPELEELLLALPHFNVASGEDPYKRRSTFGLSYNEMDTIVTELITEGRVFRVSEDEYSISKLPKTNTFGTEK